MLRKVNFDNLLNLLRQLKKTGMEKSDNQLFVFPKLNASNYSQWKVDALLIDQSCWEFIESEKVEELQYVAEKQRFKWRKERAFTTIYQGIERLFLSLISNTLDDRTAWRILQTNFETKSRVRLASLIDDFYELKFDENEETIGIFCRRVQEQKQLISEAGFEMPECLVCFQLIRKLPVEYDNLVQLLYQLEYKQFTFINIETQLINESGRIMQKKKDQCEETVADAYVSKTTSQNRTSSIRSEAALGQTNELKDGTFYSDDQNHQKLFYTTAAPVDLDEWLVDSATTSHLCELREWFDYFKNLPPSDVLIGDKNCKSRICGIDVYLPESANDQNVTAKISESKMESKLEKIDISKWTRIEKPSKKRSRIDLFYYPPSGKSRLRSNNEAIKYCNENQLENKSNYLNFKPSPKDEPEKSEKVSDLEETTDESELSNFVNDNFQEEI
ncbi:hypothetical protein AVEN_240956-1 [Araneus ventricosus]|uniref:Retrovirus-related Pol polyprotein from transposon TNT 1-94-like beta-barrel domain-containing protein n=1 Tax=Araneus ventricosus TaxID=182803 RepID=A0A4Y2R7W3_ARAVE|nr:hypothetical protein AVEN_240956-1 [Araneus ventricosus]